MSKRKFYYLEVRDGEKVVEREETNMADEHRQRQKLETFKQPHEEIFFIVTPSKEKTFQRKLEPINI